MHLALLLVIGLTSAMSQDRVDLSTQRGLFGCWSDDSFKNAHDLVGFQKMRSQDGGLVAEVEVFAKAARTDDEMGDCNNHSRFSVRTIGTIFDPEKSPPVLGQSNGNQIKLITWTADSRFIVADYLRWAWFSEGWTHTMLIYDVAHRHLEVHELYNELAPRFKKECDFDGEVIGMVDGKVSFRMGPAGNLEVPDCAADQLWLYAIKQREWKLSKRKPAGQRFGFVVPE
jgi:hypothetical protein